MTNHSSEPKHVELAALLNRDPHVALPRTLSADRADYYFGLAAAGQSAGQLRQAAGDERYQSRFNARERLADWRFEDLVQLLDAARELAFRLDRDVWPLELRRRRIVNLLDPNAPAVDDAETSRTAPAAIAAGLRGNAGAARRLAGLHHTSDDRDGEATS